MVPDTVTVLPRLPRWAKAPRDRTTMLHTMIDHTQSQNTILLSVEMKPDMGKFRRPLNGGMPVAFLTHIDAGRTSGHYWRRGSSTKRHSGRATVDRALRVGVV